MKTGTKAVTILTALLAGTVIAGAHQQNQREWQQKGHQGAGQFQRQKQGCPTCANPQFRPQGQRPQHAGPQSRQDGPPPQFRKEKQGQCGPNPHQRDQMNQKKRQAILKNFDTDKDGQLSQEERQAVREAMQERRGKPGGAADRPEPLPAD